MRWKQIVGIVLLAFGLLACDEKRDGSPTPTTVQLPTQDRTAIALLVTPTATQNPSRTASPTVSPSASASATATNTASSTATLTPTASATLTYTASPTASASRTQTRTATATASATRTATVTASATATATDTPTRTPTPSATPSPSITFSPSPSPSPSLTPLPPPATATPLPSPTTASNEASLSQTQGPGESLLVELATLMPELLLPSEADSAVPVIGGTPQAQPSVTPLPSLDPARLPTPTSVFDAANSSFSFNAGGSGLVVNYNVPVFDVASNGNNAYVGVDGQIYINNQRLVEGPADAGGLLPGLQAADMQWSSEGRFLSFVTVSQGGHQELSGVWVYDTATGETRQIMRSTAEQRVRSAIWSPDGANVVIQLDTPAGDAIAAVSRFNPPDGGVWIHRMQHATWSANGRDMVISGKINGEGIWVGRIMDVAGSQEHIAYDMQPFGLWETHAATDLADGRYIFLGRVDRAWALYSFQEGAAPVVLTPYVNGQVRTWEWSPTRAALLAVIDGDEGRQLWMFGVDGSLQDLTPPNSSSFNAHWR